MMVRVSSVFAALAAGACTAQGPALNVQAEQMELALLECKAQLGLDGKLKTEVSFGGGVATAIAVPFDKTSVAEADQINVCASGAVALNDGLLVVPMADVTPAPVAASVAVAEVAQTNGPCPMGVTGMYAGTLYCSASR